MRRNRSHIVAVVEDEESTNIESEAEELGDVFELF